MSEDFADDYTPTKWLDSLVGIANRHNISKALQASVCIIAMTFAASSMGTITMLKQPSWWIFKFAPYAVFLTAPLSLLVGLIYGFWRDHPLGRAAIALLGLASIASAALLGYILPLAGSG